MTRTISRTRRIARRTVRITVSGVVRVRRTIRFR